MSLKEHIKKHQAELDNQKMSSIKDADFERKLKRNFHSKPSKSPVKLRFLVAASILIISSIILWNQHIRFQNETIKQEIISDLQDDSTGKRLEAVYTFNETYQKEDAQMIQVLIKTLLYDENPNVKIATIEALIEFPTNEEIRQNMILALEKETEPNVQIKLIRALSLLREQRAQEPLKKIIKDETTFDIVKSNATLAMANLKQ